MYRVALVQNASEMMRYGWADIRPSMQKFGYRIDAFTGEDIHLLFVGMDENLYDAIILSVNSCNDYRILSALCEKRDTTIKNFLENGNGIYIGYQAKIGERESYGFLPEPYDLSAEIRSRTDENTSDGNLVIAEAATKHPLTTFPLQIDIKPIVEQCLNNNLVTGIYWAYIKPKNEGIYNSILLDVKYQPTRNILVTSRSDLRPRIVASMLVVEWQGHEKLWENVIRYVVEGRPSLAIISKYGTSSLSFRYLTSAIQVKKYAVAEYELRDLGEISKIPLGPHDALIIDPAWAEQEILDLDRRNSLVSKPGFSRVFYFGNSSRGDVIVNTVSNFRDFDRISKNALTWLVPQGGRENQVYWGGSFWTTVDVLATLVDFDYPIKQYEVPLAKEIKKHLDVDGSYDGVVGTTCGLIQIYHWFYGRTSPQYKRAFQWIKSSYKDKTLYEQATVLDVLARLGENIEDHEMRRFKREVSALAFTNEFSLQRYVSTLLACGYNEDAESLALKLETLQNIADGSWINIPNTATTILTLIQLQNKLRQRNPRIDEMVFKGIEFLKSNYSESKYSWHGDPLATALALRALKIFEKQITFPVDELLVSLEGVNRESRSMIAIDAAIRLNLETQQKINELQSSSSANLNELNSIVQKEKQDGKFAKDLSLITSIFTLLTISSSALFINYLLQNQKFSDFLNLLVDFIRATYTLIIPTLAVIPLFFWVLLLIRYKRMPMWLESLIKLVK